MSEPITNVITKEERDKLSPEEVLQHLKDGNERFKTNQLINRNAGAMVKDSNSGQAPKAIILSCVDSRVPVEEIFDQGIGDIFVARVAGNFVNEDILGSMEYACGVAGSKLIVVMGHQHCGALTSAIKGVELGNITAMLSKIKPAIDQVEDFDGTKDASNPKFIEAVTRSNVANTIRVLRRDSEMLRDLEASNDTGKKIKIIGAVYGIHTDEGKNGTVDFFEVEGIAS